MGGGNAQKSAMSRAKNQAKADASNKGSQLADNAKAMSIKCHICLQTFICTTNEAKCHEHADNKHPGKDFYAAFPHLKPA